MQKNANSTNWIELALIIYNPLWNMHKGREKVVFFRLERIRFFRNQGIAKLSKRKIRLLTAYKGYLSIR